MSNVTLPQNKVAVSGMGGLMTRDWYRWAHDVTLRIGGVGGESIDDLVLSAFDDAGIEEAKHDTARLRDEVRQAPMLGSIAELVARVDALTAEVAALKQGVML